MEEDQRLDDLERSVRILRALVYDEYPTDWSLVDIAKTWCTTSVSKRDVEALDRVERFSFYQASVDPTSRKSRKP